MQHASIATPSRAVHRWRAPATCGERLQGALDGENFMVTCPIDLPDRSARSTCPIDLFATAHAVATSDSGVSLHLLNVDEAEAARLLTAVEPSDCTHFRGMAQLNFVSGTLIDRLPAPSGLHLLAVDCGGEVGSSESFLRLAVLPAAEPDRLASALQSLLPTLQDVALHQA